MKYEHITSDRQLAEFCRRVSGADVVSLDTEFVSEDSYRSHLCLVQLEVDGLRAIIDTIQVRDVGPLWEWISSGPSQTIVHAGREEFVFCLRSAGRRPAGLVDIQLAAGLAGLEYPAAYHKLVSKILNKDLPKTETRTDWRRRPLAQRQLEYALHDIDYLRPVRDRLIEQLEHLGRLAWLEAEMESWQEAVETQISRPQWRRVSGISGLSSRSLAVVREIWAWREAEAERRDRLPRRVLRDDLIVELARRASASPNHIRAIRGMERRDLIRDLPNLSAAIARGLELPEDQLPGRNCQRESNRLKVLGQLLNTALNSICRQAKIAPSIVGTVQDVRDLAAYRLGIGDSTGEPPALARGWRAEIVGNQIDELLAGKLCIRIQDPLSEQPLGFEPAQGGK